MPNADRGAGTGEGGRADEQAGAAPEPREEQAGDAPAASEQPGDLRSPRNERAGATPEHRNEQGGDTPARRKEQAGDAPEGPGTGAAAARSRRPAGAVSRDASASEHGMLRSEGNVASEGSITVDLDWRSVAVFLAAFVGFVALSGLVRDATRSITWIGLGTLLALALDPLVSRLQARLGGRRREAVAIVLSGFVVAIALLVLVFGPPAARQAGDLGDDLPDVVADLENLPIIGDDLRDNDVPERVEDFLDDLPERLAGDTTPIENAGRSIAGGALAATATMLAAITLLLDGERLLARIRRLVPPARRETADRVGRLLYRSIGQYFAGSVLVAVIAGVAVASVGLVLGVPLAPLAGAWVAVFNLVPQIGGAVGGVPFVLLGLTESATTGLICAGFFVLYLQFENNFLSPLIVGKSVDLSPPATMTAALVGVSAAGVVGALVAVPLLGAAKAIYVELRHDDLDEGGPVEDHAESAEGKAEAPS